MKCCKFLMGLFVALSISLAPSVEAQSVPLPESITSTRFYELRSNAGNFSRQEIWELGRSDNAADRQFAILQMADLRRPRDAEIHRVVEALFDSNEIVRAQALAGLQRLGSRAQPALVRYLADTSEIADDGAAKSFVQTSPAEEGEQPQVLRRGEMAFLGLMALPAVEADPLLQMAFTGDLQFQSERETLDRDDAESTFASGGLARASTAIARPVSPAARALYVAAHRGSSVTGLVIRGAMHEDLRVRIASAAIIARAAGGDDRAFHSLQLLSRDADPAVRSIAVYGLDNVGEAAAEDIERLTFDSDADVRSDAVRFLTLRTPDASVRLSALMLDPDRDVARAAVSRFIELGDITNAQGDRRAYCTARRASSTLPILDDATFRVLLAPDGSLPKALFGEEIFHHRRSDILAVAACASDDYALAVLRMAEDAVLQGIGDRWDALSYIGPASAVVSWVPSEAFLELLQRSLLPTPTSQRAFQSVFTRFSRYDDEFVRDGGSAPLHPALALLLVDDLGIDPVNDRIREQAAAFCRSQLQHAIGENRVDDREEYYFSGFQPCENALREVLADPANWTRELVDLVFRSDERLVKFRAELIGALDNPKSEVQVEVAVRLLLSQDRLDVSPALLDETTKYKAVDVVVEHLSSIEKPLRSIDDSQISFAIIDQPPVYEISELLADYGPRGEQALYRLVRAPTASFVRAQVLRHYLRSRRDHQGSDEDRALVESFIDSGDDEMWQAGLSALSSLRKEDAVQILSRQPLPIDAGQLKSIAYAWVDTRAPAPDDLYERLLTHPDWDTRVTGYDLARATLGSSDPRRLRFGREGLEREALECERLEREIDRGGVRIQCILAAPIRLLAEADADGQNVLIEWLSVERNFTRPDVYWHIGRLVDPSDETELLQFLRARDAPGLRSIGPVRIEETLDHPAGSGRRVAIANTRVDDPSVQAWLTVEQKTLDEGERLVWLHQKQFLGSAAIEDRWDGAYHRQLPARPIAVRPKDNASDWGKVINSRMAFPAAQDARGSISYGYIQRWDDRLIFSRDIENLTMTSETVGSDTSAGGRRLSIAWPPPAGFRAVSFDVMGERLIGADWGEVQRNLTASISAADRDGGFEWGIVEGPPDGFAIVLRTERIDRQGNPLEGEARWAVENPAKLDLSQLAGDLFFQAPGYFRTLVFVVTTDQRIAQGVSGILPDPREGWRSYEIARTVVPGSRIWALVYTHRRRAGGMIEPWTQGPSASQHLERAGFSVVRQFAGR